MKQNLNYQPVQPNQKWDDYAYNRGLKNLVV
jgi:hypothetical protein